jgi:hypothetical protein
MVIRGKTASGCCGANRSQSGKGPAAGGQANSHPSELAASQGSLFRRTLGCAVMVIEVRLSFWPRVLHVYIPDLVTALVAALA